MEQQHQPQDAASAMRALAGASEHRLAKLPIELCLLSCEDLALVYGISAARARARCAAGTIAGAFKTDGKWRVRATDLIAAWDAAKEQLDVGDVAGRLEGWETLVPRKRQGSP